MTTKEAFKNPGVLLFLGVLIGGAIVWISKGLTTGSWNLYATTPTTEGSGGTTQTNSGRMANDSLEDNERQFREVPSSVNLIQNERNILTNLYAQLNRLGKSDQALATSYINEANKQLSKIGNKIKITLDNQLSSQNDTAKQKKNCADACASIGCGYWVAWFIFGRICHCSECPPEVK